MALVKDGDFVAVEGTLKHADGEKWMIGKSVLSIRTWEDGSRDWTVWAKYDGTLSNNKNLPAPRYELTLRGVAGQTWTGMVVVEGSFEGELDLKAAGILEFEN